jgi:hypothetical protein
MKRLLLTLLLVACSGDLVTPVVTTVVGDYQLTAHNDTALPWLLASGPTSTTHISAGVLSLHADSTFTRTNTHTVTLVSDGSVTTTTLTQSGSYTVIDSVVVLEVTSEGVFWRGVASGSALTLTPMANGTPMTDEQWRYER